MLSSRLRSLPATVMTGSVFALALSLTPALPSSASTTRPAGASATALAAAAAAEGTPIQLFADKVNTLGITHYAGSFAGAALTSPTIVTVYATHNDTALLNAIARVPRGNVRIVIRTVPHSYTQLNALAVRIGNDGAMLSARGVNVAGLTPDPATGTVQVALAKPSGNAPGLTTTHQVDNARTVLTERYGTGWIAVSSTTTPLAHSAAERDYDSSPFTAGDMITLDGLNCTVGFTTVGNVSGNDFLLTAGHCGTGSVTADWDGVSMGSVASQYISGSEDFDTIRALGHGRVWYGDDYTTGYYIVSGFTIPADSTLMTVDGDENAPEHTGQYVVSDDFYSTYTINGTTHSVGPGIQIKTPYCVGGDSGGPAYVRNGSTGKVWAVGTIDSTDGTYCFVYRLDQEESKANVSLYIGSS